MTTSYNGHTLKHSTVEDFERWSSPSGALMTDQEYDRHFKRVRKMLSDSGEYKNAEDILDTDTSLILQMPHLNPEFF